MPIVFGRCVGNQTGLQNTGRKLPGSDWPKFIFRGKKTTFLPAANAPFVASSHCWLTNTSAGGCGAWPAGYTQISHWLTKEVPRSATRTDSLHGAGALLNDAWIAPSGVNRPVVRLTAGRLPEASATPSGSQILHSGRALPRSLGPKCATSTEAANVSSLLKVRLFIRSRGTVALQYCRCVCGLTKPFESQKGSSGPTRAVPWVG